MANEEDEVRTLLMRHRKQIIREINESELITILTKKGVLTAAHQIQLDNVQNSGNLQNIELNNATTPSKNNIVWDTVNSCTNAGVSGIGNESDTDEKKCTYLIDVIASSGFEKFKEFCYAIESECSKLIGDLIHDQLNGSSSRNGKSKTLDIDMHKMSTLCERV